MVPLGVAKTDIKAKTLLDMNDAVEGIQAQATFAHTLKIVQEKVLNPKDKLLKANNGIHLWFRLLVLSLELVCKGEFGGLLLQLGELVLILGHLFQCGLDELALHV